MSIKCDLDIKCNILDFVVPKHLERGGGDAPWQPISEFTGFRPPKKKLNLLIRLGMETPALSTSPLALSWSFISLPASARDKNRFKHVYKVTACSSVTSNLSLHSSFEQHRVNWQTEVFNFLGNNNKKHYTFITLNTLHWNRWFYYIEDLKLLYSFLHFGFFQTYIINLSLTHLSFIRNFPI